MRRILVALALVALVDGTAAAGQSGFVYALQQVNGGVNFIYGFRFDQTTGALTLLPGFPMSSQGTGTGANNSEQLAYANGRLFVANDGDNTLAVFSVNLSTGALTAMPYSPVALGTGNWGCVAVHPIGSIVVVGNGGTSTIASFFVSNVAATAAPGSPFTTGLATPFSCRFSQDGVYVYTGGNTGNSFAGFSVNAGTGVLTALAGSPFDSGASNPLGFASDSNGRLFSVAGTSPQVRAFTTAAGIPSGVTGNPFASGLTTGTQGVVHRAGFYMVADRAGNRVGVYQIAGAGPATTLTAVSGSPFAAGATFTNALALSSDGAHLVAANGTSRNLTVFQVNQSTGALSTVSVQPSNTLGTVGILTGLVFAPGEAGFVYSITQGDGSANQIYGFRINPNTGGLIALPGFPVSTGGTGSFGTSSEHLAYQNGRLYAINDGSDTLSAFKVNRTTGALTPLPFSPLALVPQNLACVAVHPSGSPVVVGNSAGGLASFDVNATTATAAPGSPFPTPSAFPFSCGFSSDGNYVYTGGNGAFTFAGFSVDAVSGVLTPLPGSPFTSGGGQALGYATDASGRLFMANYDAGTVRGFTTSGGVPTAVSGNPFASGLIVGIDGVRHPAGYYIVADRVGNRVGVYQIAGSGAATTLTPVTGSPFAALGDFTDAVTLTEDGGFLIAANGGSRNLTVFRVNPASGVLTPVALQSANTLGATGLLTGVVFAPVVPPFIDDPLTALTSVIKAVHITDLRARIDAVRAQYGLSPLAYTDPTLAVATTPVRLAHVAELRAALNEVYVALGMAPPAYTDPAFSVGVTVAKLAHIMELRAAVVAIE